MVVVITYHAYHATYGRGVDNTLLREAIYVGPDEETIREKFVKECFPVVSENTKKCYGEHGYGFTVYPEDRVRQLSDRGYN
jgi:hypothetical protein